MPQSLTISIDPKGKKHRMWLDALRNRQRMSRKDMSKYHKVWKKAEETFVAYLPEKDADAARRVKRDNAGKTDYTTIVVPYSYAVLMTSHTYWTTVLLGRDPINQYTGRHGESSQQVQSMEALMDYQVQVGGAKIPYTLWLMDVGKYGIGILGDYWTEEIAQISEIVDEKVLIAGFMPTGMTKKKKRTRRIPGYQGNKLYNVRPHDFFPDTRIPLTRFQEGEFCIIYKEMGWNEVLRREEKGLYTNIDRLRKTFSSSTTSRETGSAQIELPDITDMFTNEDGIDQNIKSAATKAFFECYVELIPHDWGVGASKSPEKWVFTCDDNFELIIGATPLGAIHDKFPFQVIELEPEAYSIANRGMMETLQPIQNTMDWLINSHFYNVRKTLNDQFVVDPSRIVMADVQEGGAGGMIRLKPRAYGTDPSQAIKQLQVVDITRGHMTDLNTMMQLGQRVSGVSDQLMGMLAGTGRKTAQEVRSSNTFGINRLKTQVEFFSNMGFAPLSQMMVQNSQQYYDANLKLRIVGDLAIESGMEFLEVDAESLQGFYDFVPVDGTLPIDRFAQANLWRELFAQMRNFPEIMAQYDMTRIFAWVAQLAGLKNINQFRIKITPDGQTQTDVDLGNLIALTQGASNGRGNGSPGGGGGQPRGAERDLGRVPEPGQVPGMGTTG